MFSFNQQVTAAFQKLQQSEETEIHSATPPNSTSSSGRMEWTHNKNINVINLDDEDEEEHIQVEQETQVKNVYFTFSQKA